MRRLLLAILAVGIPAVEIFVIVQVAYAIGWWTLLALVVSSAVGAWLVKRAGIRAWARIREALSSGELPEDEMGDAGAVLLAGLLIAFPGFVTDAAGVLAVLPPLRPVTRRVVRRLATGRLGSLDLPTGFGTYPGAPSNAERDGAPPGPVVRGRVVRRDEDEDDDSSAASS